MDSDQEQIDAYFKEIFEDEEFQAYCKKLTDDLIQKHVVEGEPFDPVCFEASWDDQDV